MEGRLIGVDCLDNTITVSIKFQDSEKLIEYVRENLGADIDLRDIEDFTL